jgi:hypothetical protein
MWCGVPPGLSGSEVGCDVIVPLRYVVLVMAPVVATLDSRDCAPQAGL